MIELKGKILHDKQGKFLFEHNGIQQWLFKKHVKPIYILDSDKDYTEALIKITNKQAKMYCWI